MDPITAAIVAACADLAKGVIKDSYEALKVALKKKFGSDSDLVDAVEKLEKKPDSEVRRSAIQEEVELAKATEDPVILKLAQDLLDQIKEQPDGQEMINNTQTNTVSGGTFNFSGGGSFEFKPVQEGRKG